MSFILQYARIMLKHPHYIMYISHYIICYCLCVLLNIHYFRRSFHYVKNLIKLQVEKVQEVNDQKKAQSEKNPTPKTEIGKN